MTIGSKPDWIKGIKDKLDYGWRYKGKISGIQPDVSIILNKFDAEMEALADKGINGASSLRCFQCGTCNAVCPYPMVMTENNILSARIMIHEAQLGLIDFETEKIWLCVTCGACVEQCPRGVEIMDFMSGLRRIEIGIGVGKIPDSLRRAVTNIASVGNPFGEPQGKRADWADSFGVMTFIKGMELLYFPGCFPAYDPRAKKIAQAIASILRRAEVDFGVLGSEEKCCGQSVRKMGAEELFQNLARSNIHAFAESGVKRILTTSPHCYHTLKTEYTEFGGDFEIVHHTQYIAQLIAEGRIKFSKKLDKKVTYHDPCYLGRHNGIYDEPRQILQSIPGLELVEMPASHHSSLCCGGGGGGMWLENKKGERLSDFRLAQAIETGADILAVACPYCLLSFEDSKLTAPGGDNIEVKDIAELVWDAI